MSDQYTPTVLDEMRTAFAMRHWHKTDDFKAGQRIFDDQIATIEAAAEQRGAVKGYEVGYRDGMRDEEQVQLGRYVQKINPYRADRITDQEDNDAG